MSGMMLRAATAASLLLLPGAVAAQSFDCAKAATPTEVAICRSPALKAHDGELAAAWKGALAAAREAEAAGIGRAAAALRANQVAWLRERDACGADGACLSRRIGGRTEAVGLLAVAFRAAAREPVGDTAPATLAWRAWLAREIGAETGVSGYEQALGAVADEFIAELAEDMASGDALRDGLNALRLASDDAGEEVPCGLLAWHGAAAIVAFEAKYGSTRDATAPTNSWSCLPDGKVAPSETWERIVTLLSDAMQASFPNLGTMRYSINAGEAIAELRAARFPETLASDAAALDGALAFLRDWANPQWLDPSARAEALDLARKAVSDWEASLRPTLGDKAKGAALALAVARLNALEGSLQGVRSDVDTRLPEAFIGTWRAPGRPDLTIGPREACGLGGEGCEYYEADPEERLAWLPARAAAAGFALGTARAAVNVGRGTQAALALGQGGELAVFDPDDKAAVAVYRRVPAD